MSTRSSGFILYTEKNSLDGDRIAISMLEKNITCEQIIVDITNPPENLLDINTQLILPALVTREIALYYPNIILEYIDERFPHPSLLPHDPINRGKFRLMLKRILTEWYPLLSKAIIKQEIDKKTAKSISDLLIQYSDLFGSHKFFQSDDFSIIDATLAPFFWWINRLEVDIPKKAEAILDYSDRVLARGSVHYIYEERSK